MTSAALIPSLEVVVPELIVALGAMALLLFGVFRGDSALRRVAWMGVLVLAAAFFAVLGTGRPAAAFGDMFVVNDFTVFAKVLILLGSALAILMSLDYLQHEKAGRFEYPVLILLATLGMMMMVSANDLIALYVGLELQSLALYVLAAIKRDSVRSTEAGLKYFVLGALASGMLLYGASLIYGFTGTTNFATLAGVLAGEAPASVGVIVGLVFLISGLAFKVSAVPFHMWTPDVYEGTPTPVTAFFSVAPKIAALVLFVRTLVTPFPALIGDWQQIIVFISVASMILGAFAAITQSNIKRLMAYSSIGHVGYALMGLAAGTAEGVSSILIYLTIYLAMNTGAFACILMMRTSDGMTENIEDLAGLNRDRPWMAAAFAIFMFSLAGIPPLAGFFAKWWVFFAAIDAGLWLLAVIGAVTSVVAAYYYLRIIKVIYFDEPETTFERLPGREMGIIMAISAFFVLFYAVSPGALTRGAEAAAAALFL